jgi:precorrin-6B methylase 2
MELVVFAGKDKENWGQISALLNRGQWDKIVVVRGKEAENFPKNWNFDEVVIDTGKPLEEMKSELMGKLKNRHGV